MPSGQLPENLSTLMILNIDRQSRCNRTKPGRSRENKKDKMNLHDSRTSAAAAAAASQKQLKTAQKPALHQRLPPSLQFGPSINITALERQPSSSRQRHSFSFIKLPTLLSQRKSKYTPLASSLFHQHATRAPPHLLSPRPLRIRFTTHPTLLRRPLRHSPLRSNRSPLLRATHQRRPKPLCIRHHARHRRRRQRAWRRPSH